MFSAYRMFFLPEAKSTTDHPVYPAAYPAYPVNFSEAVVLRASL